MDVLADEEGLALCDDDVDHAFGLAWNDLVEAARRERRAQRRRTRHGTGILRHERHELLEPLRVAERLPRDACEDEPLAERRARVRELEREQARPREREARLRPSAQHLPLGERRGRDVGDDEDEGRRHARTIRER
jgi:hypothetical protein